MAQANNKKGFYPESPNAHIGYYPIATGQTLTAGDAVILSSGQVAIALANSARLLGVVARDCASLAAGTLVPVYDDPDTVFIGCADADSSSSTAPSQIDLVGATGAMLLDVGASSTDVFILLNALPDDTTSTALARWRFKIYKHEAAAIS